MAARYATDTFSVQLASGASKLIMVGSQHDSASPEVVAAPSKFTASPVTGLHPRLAGYLTDYPDAEVH